MCKLLFQAFIFLWSLQLGSQNLVPDSSLSFRNNETHWFTYSNWRAIYSAPNKDWGYNWIELMMQEIDSTHQDVAMMMILTDASSASGEGKTNCVAYCELLEPLKKDCTYVIRLKVLPPVFLGINHLQVYFSDMQKSNAFQVAKCDRTDLYTSDSTVIINQLLQVTKRKKKEPVQSYGIMTFGYLVGKWNLQFENKWKIISGTYKATGGEKFFYIGNLNDFQYTVYRGRIRNGQLVKSRKNDPGDCPSSGGILYLDDISIRLAPSYLQR